MIGSNSEMIEALSKTCLQCLNHSNFPFHVHLSLVIQLHHNSSLSNRPISFLGSINTSRTRLNIAPPRIEPTTVAIFLLLDNK
mmetsp:Transcript_29217/g.62126  ORF Transcript_29217/g.62126 Transcript_29217/m.62126 type:complete len:83 (+) Transcript_29217:69-317(+)